jgi:NAD(P)H-dependent flavin oxidoreductase YrpB (nitropropane dioxygenase family)
VEAGGHVQGTTPLAGLLAAVAAACPLPLVAAGGIASRAAAARAVAAGAGAVAAGTRFLLATEAAVHPAYAAALLEAAAADTTLTGLFDGGWPEAPHRVLRNSTYRRWQAAGEPPPGRRPGEGEQIAREGERRLLRYGDDMPNRSVEGAAEALALYAGEGVSDCRALEPAAAIVADLAAGSV